MSSSAHSPILDGRHALSKDGLSYQPQFIGKEEAQELIEYFASLHPIWEERYRGEESQRGKGARRLTRPVYWLGAWQFACLGYYSEPDHRENRCVRGEAFPAIFSKLLQRAMPLLAAHGVTRAEELPNTCLINYYGRDLSPKVPIDYARLRMHRDSEPGPVIMLSIGQPAQLDFLDPNRSPEPEFSIWNRHRSLSIISGDYKDRLYHRISNVRTGKIPEMPCQLDKFDLRRVSVSFRKVPDSYIKDYVGMPNESRAQIEDYLHRLAANSAHYSSQLSGARISENTEKSARSSS